MSPPRWLCGACRAQLEGLLNEYQVDLVVSGHVHSYRWVSAGARWHSVRDTGGAATAAGVEPVGLQASPHALAQAASGTAGCGAARAGAGATGEAGDGPALA